MAYWSRVADRPPFAQDYPADPRLNRLLELLSRGNHRAVREGAAALSASAEDPAVVAAAQDLRARLEPDPLAPILLGTTAVLLIALTLFALGRSREHRAHPAAPPKTVQTVK